MSWTMHGRRALKEAPRVATPFAGTAAVMQALEADLRRHVRGEVRFDQGSKALYAADASNYRQVPLAVVVPRTSTICSPRSPPAAATTCRFCRAAAARRRTANA